MGFFDPLGLFSSNSKPTNSSTSTALSTTSVTNQADNRVVLGNGAAQQGAFSSYLSTSDSSNHTNNETSFQVFDSSQRNTAYTDARTTIDAKRSDTNFLVNDSSQRSESTAYTDARNLSNQTSLLVNDSSQRNTSTAYTDARNLSDASSRNFANSNNVYNTGTDGGSVRIAEFNAQLLRAVSADQGETVKLLAQMGADGVSKQAGAATNLFATSSASSSAAWGHTIDRSAELVDKLMSTSRENAGTAAASWGHTVDKSAELIDKLLFTARGTVAGANAVASQAVASFTPTANKQADAMKYAMLAAVALIAMKFLKA